MYNIFNINASIKAYACIKLKKKKQFYIEQKTKIEHI